MAYNDLSDRLPLFEAYSDAVADLSPKTLDYVNPAVVDSMKHCVPVGVRSNNTLAIPKQYEPEDGPLVLMLHEGENVDVRWSNGMERAVQHVLGAVGLTDSSISCSVEHRTSSALGALHSVWIDHPPAKSRLYAPLFIGLRPQRFAVDRAIVLAHETDHWNFYYEASLLELAGGRAPEPDEVDALAEKRAFITQYTMKGNRGLDALFMSPEKLAERLVGLDPEAAAKRAIDIVHDHWQRNRLGSPYPTEIAVLALSLCFADEDPSVPITTDEVRAYRALGVVEGSSGTTI